MAQFKPYAAGVEVTGETVLSIVNGMGAFRNNALKILAESGIPNPAPGMWYPQDAWLKAFKTIHDTLGDVTLFSIGKSIPQSAKFPPGIDSLGKALNSIDMAYNMNHRGGFIGSYKLVREEERLVKMVCNNPYPCEFDRGIISAMIEKFKPKGSPHFAVLEHDSEHICRKKGGDFCTYKISW